MARVTIEDCIKEIDNTFDICTLASKRAKDLAAGAESSLGNKNKPSVLALKEIADQKIGLDYFEISNKQLADSKLFSGINEQEIVEELSQKMEEEAITNTSITSEPITDSPITESPITNEPIISAQNSDDSNDNDIRPVTEESIPSSLDSDEQSTSEK
tara:strand:- start:1703 stop:2176 length:474 start_codon:yes stop_codon:yes gene_type:complete